MITIPSDQSKILSQEKNYNIFKDVSQWLTTASQPQLGNQDQFQLVKNLILEELEELEEAVKSGDKQEQRDAIVDLLWVTLNWDYMNSLNSEEHAQKVSFSNWTKFCTSEEEAIKTVDAYIRGIHPSKPGIKIECYMQQSGDYWIIKRLSDNKVLKSINFIEP